MGEFPHNVSVAAIEPAGEPDLTIDERHRRLVMGLIGESNR